VDIKPRETNLLNQDKRQLGTVPVVACACIIATAEAKAGESLEPMELIEASLDNTVRPQLQKKKKGERNNDIEDVLA
jgi:hypothetical protein